MRSYIFLLFPFLVIHCKTKTILSDTDLNTDTAHRFLALGDSYTIGEGVQTGLSFPYQTIEILKKSGFNFSTPGIIARTGWTTDELMAAINNTELKPPYNIVSLLIGVNDQYRGRSSVEYAQQFRQLLEKAIELAGNNSNRVFVISIPDWGSTPYAQGRDRNKIAKEIDEFNSVNRSITNEKSIMYIDITPGSKNALTDSTLVTTDGLHPSSKEYQRWSQLLASAIEAVIK